jgi:hypothetical protein
MKNLFERETVDELIAHRQAAACNATALGKNGSCPDVGALFRGTRYGFGPHQPAARIDREVDRIVGQANLHE